MTRVAPPMIAVGVCELATSPAEEAPHFARESGLSLYEARLKLSQPPPLVAIRTNDRDAARKMVASLRARGHVAVACDEDAIAAPAPVREIRFAEDALVCDGHDLPYARILVIVRAIRATRAETVERITTPRVATAGDTMATIAVTHEEMRVAHDKEELLYVFSREGGPPWLVGERDTRYAALDHVARSQRENFLHVVSTLRERAPNATYDERLLASRGQIVAREIDVRAQLVAISAAQRVYR